MSHATHELNPKQAFDTLAEDYDASFTITALGRYLRSRVWERYDACFTGKRRLLDIGCGTGEDAIYLALKGHDVVATDVSAAMLRLAASKAGHAGCAGRIELRRTPMERLGVELAGERFDGVCSNFGAINCASRLETLVADIAPLLAPAAPLVWVVMGRHVPWEWAWFLARAEWRKAFRRLRSGGADFRGITVVYPTPAQMTAVLRPQFGAIRRRPLGLFLPPTYASDWLERSPSILAALKRCDGAASRSQRLAALADHYVIEACRLPLQAAA